jgi:hypothetical protein
LRSGGVLRNGVNARRAAGFTAALIAAAGFMPVAAHAAVIDPEGSPLTLHRDSTGHVEQVTIAASGFAPGATVFIEQCDGIDETTANWSPVEHCDLGSSPAPVLADRAGVARFRADDRNHAFLPFVGESPQSLFNCVASVADAPNNNLPTFTNCRLRVSSNNTLVTSDQSALSFVLPAKAASARPPIPGSVAARANSKNHRNGSPSPTTPSDAKSNPSAARISAGANARSSAPAATSSDDGVLAHLGVATGLLLVLTGVAIAAWCVARRRRGHVEPGPMWPQG